jgi:F-box interacting protein
MNRPKSLSNNNGYLVYVPTREDHYNYYAQHLCTVVCNNDQTLTPLSRFEVPFHAHMVGFCNGMYCLIVHYSNIIYLWNPSIRKFKMLSIRRLTDPSAPGAIGLAYHSQNNDFKILRVVCDRESNVPLAVAEVYTLSTDSWRRFVISLRSIDYIDALPCLFFNGALHSLANHESDKFILSFDVNDEMFREIMLPQNYLDEVVDDVLDLAFERLAVFKGSLALFVFFLDAPGNSICHIWVMREYGVVESWTKISVPLDSVNNFDGCTDSGELLICINGRGFISYDLESLNENDLGISHSWLIYTADLMENLVLLDQVKFHLNMRISLYTKSMTIFVKFN